MCVYCSGVGYDTDNMKVFFLYFVVSEYHNLPNLFVWERKTFWVFVAEKTYYGLILPCANKCKNKSGQIKNIFYRRVKLLERIKVRHKI